MKRLLLCALLVACNDPDMLTDARCGAPCYTGPTKTRNVGECKDGSWNCETETCDDQIRPAHEFCESGVDSNCDGKLGSNVHDEWYNTFCGPSGVGNCRPGYWQCSDGIKTCIGGTPPQPEDCSGRDMDCNGKADDIQLGLCYEGVLADLSFPEATCQAGLFACDPNGTIVCAGQVLPEPETCGANEDRNCNGLIDDVPNTSTATYDLVIILDRSASMISVDDLVRGAIEEFALMHSTAAFRYALIDLAGHSVEPVRLIKNFTDGRTFAAVIANDTILDGGEEYSYDAIVDAATGALDLVWQADHRLIVFFGDEEAQTSPERLLTESAVVGILSGLGYQISVFESPSHFQGFDAFASVYNLYQTQVEISNLLKAEIGVCR